MINILTFSLMMMSILNPSYCIKTSDPTPINAVTPELTILSTPILNSKLPPTSQLIFDPSTGIGTQAQIGPAPASVLKLAQTPATTYCQHVSVSTEFPGHGLSLGVNQCQATPLNPCPEIVQTFCIVNPPGAQKCKIVKTNICSVFKSIAINNNNDKKH